MAANCHVTLSRQRAEKWKWAAKLKQSAGGGGVAAVLNGSGCKKSTGGGSGGGSMAVALKWKRLQGKNNQWWQRRW